MPSIMPGVVDQHIHRFESRDDPAHAVAKGVNVGEITGEKVRLRPGVGADLVHQLHSSFFLDVQKSHMRALLREPLDDFFANTTGASSHDHDPVAQARVGSVFHWPVVGHPEFPLTGASMLHGRR